MKRARRVAILAATVLAALLAQWALGRAVGATDIIAAALSGRLFAPAAVLGVFALRVFLLCVAPGWGLALGVGALVDAVAARGRRSEP